MFNNTLDSTAKAERISGTITFTNGKKYVFNVTPFTLTGAYSGKLTAFATAGSGQSDTEEAFKPQTFGYRSLGIADYQKVVSKICRYEAGEVAHIENVMARELREKSTTRFQQTQVVETEGAETETEKMTDASSAERFEMQTEIAKMLHEDKQFEAHASVSATWGPVSIDAGASFASSVSKEESNRQAINQAKEITQRASERIVSRVKNEKTTTTTDEFTEENSHIFDNRGSSEHVSGIYRFINAVYKNQIHNYGKRLMYEFMVPQPSKLHRLGMAVSAGEVLEKPKDPRETLFSNPVIPVVEYGRAIPAFAATPARQILTGEYKLTDFTKITKDNYQFLAAKYNAEVKEYPREEIYVTKSFAGVRAGADEMLDGTADIQLPDGYITQSATLNLFCRYDDHDFGTGNQRHAAGISFGNVNLYAAERRENLTENKLEGYKSVYNLPAYRDSISLSYTILNYMAFSIAFSVKMKLDETKKAQWQRETFEAIIKGYEQQLKEYNQSLAEAKSAGVRILDSNPLFYRQIEQTVLRQNCISYLTNSNNPNSVKKLWLADVQKPRFIHCFAGKS